MAEQQEFHNVDPRIWKECAGDSLTVPKLHSKVYYFPLAHLEHSPNPQTLSLLHHPRPFVLCTLSSVDFLADSITDQIFAKLLLTPVIDATAVPVQPTKEDDVHADADRVVSYSKTLTRSDANNGGAFSVPRACATSIFPPLDLTTPSPSQQLSVTDFCGVVWTFRLVYRGNPKRDLFTTGWSAFVDKKQLIGGDTIVFIQNSAGKIFVGIRRKYMSGAANKITEKTVMNAVELAHKNTPFEVVCYPTVEGFNFVVPDKVVEDAIKIRWNPGMRVAHTVKGRSTFHGTISAISHASTHPWRMLEVEWDDSQVSENLKHVSPWQVESDFSILLLHQQFSPPKRIRAAQGYVLLTDAEGTSSISMKPLNQTPLYFDDILGVSQNHISGSTSSKDSSFEKISMKMLDNVSIDLNTTSHKLDYRGGLNFSDTKSTDIPNFNTEKVTPDSIISFGHIIHPPVKSCFDDSAILGVSQNHISGSTSSISLKDSSFETISMKRLDNVSIDLNTTSHKLDYRGGLNFSDTKSTDIRNCNTEKVPPDSIKLFGHIIHPPVKSWWDDYAIKRADGSQMHSEVEDKVKYVDKK